MDRAEVLIKATGFVNDWRWPDVPGREKFKGAMLHTARWDDSFDPEGKKVAVLGYGSTGVQITPAIQPLVKQIDHYVRGKVWVPPGGGTNMEELIERGAHNNCKFLPSTQRITAVRRLVPNISYVNPT